MEINYSVGARVPGGGIGNLAAQALKAVYQKHYLKQAYVTSNGTDFLPPNLVTAFELGDRIPFYLLKDNLFDLFTRSRIKRSDIFHVWNNYGLFTIPQAKKLGAKIVIERASSHIRKQEEILKAEHARWGIKQSPINPLTLKKSSKEYDLADYVLVPSEFVYQSFLELNYPEKKLALVPFGVDVKKFYPAKEKRSGKFELLFVGQISVRKGVPYLLQAWEELGLKDAELVLVGPQSSEIKGFLDGQRLVDVRFVEYTERVLEYYQSAAGFVFPSIEEGSALVTYEALACGLPVITTFNSGSVVEDQKDGLIVKPGDKEKLKEAISDLYNNQTRAREMGVAARRKAEKYSWENYHQRLVAFYEGISTK